MSCRIDGMDWYSIDEPDDPVRMPVETVKVKVVCRVKRQIEHQIAIGLAISPSIELNFSGVVAHKFDIDFIVWGPRIAARIGEEGRHQA